MRRSIIAIVPVLILAACSAQEMNAYDHHQRFRNTVESRELTVSFPAGELSAADRAAVRDLAREYTRRGAAPVDISGPAAKVGEIAAILGDFGVDPGRIVLSVHDGDKSVVSVPVWVAVVPECGRWGTDLTSDAANQNTDNFGCAVTRNIGLMVSDPADLVRARDPSGRAGTRAADVIGKYGQGKATSSASEAAASGTLSTVGK